MRAELTGQYLTSRAGLSGGGGLLNAVGFRALCENRFSQRVTKAAIHHLNGLIINVTMILTKDGEHRSFRGLFRNEQACSPAAFDRFPGQAE